MSKISTAALDGLAKKIRESADTLKNLTFADATTAKTAVKTQDLRLDVHRNTQDPSMATGIVQANSEATDKTVKDFIKKKTGGHRGTHQVIGEKIKFSLGNNFNVEEVVGGLEKNK